MREKESGIKDDGWSETQSFQGQLKQVHAVNMGMNSEPGTGSIKGGNLMPADGFGLSIKVTKAIHCLPCLYNNGKINSL